MKDTSQQFTAAQQEVLRLGQPGPWRALVPEMLGVVAERYVWVGYAPMPSPSYRGKPSPFMPAAADQDRNIRSRTGQQALPGYRQSTGKQRPFRDGYQPRPNVYRQYFPQAARRWSDMGTAPRTLSSAEIKGVRLYEPKRTIKPDDWPAIREFVVEATLTVAPYSITDPLKYISLIVRYVDWCHRVMGMDLVVDEIFDFDMIAYYAMNATDEVHSKASKGSIRARLLWAGDHLVPGGVRERVLERAGRTPVTAPYSQAEILLLKKWAVAQYTPYSRHMCWTVLAFGLGAGLTSGELINLKREDVAETPDAVMVTVRDGDAPRQVVVTADWEDYAVVLAEAVTAGSYVFNCHTTVRESKGVSQALRRAKARPGSLRINMEKLRLTWFVRLLNSGCPVPVFLKAAGLKGMSGLERIVPYLDEGPAEAAVAALRAFDAARKAKFRAGNRDYCNDLRRQRDALRRDLAKQVGH